MLKGPINRGVLVTPEGLLLLLQGGQASRSNGSANGSRGEQASDHVGTETPKILGTLGLLVATKACHMYLLPTLPESLVHTEKPSTRMKRCTHTGNQKQNKGRIQNSDPTQGPVSPRGSGHLTEQSLHIQTTCSTARPHRQGL